MDFINRDYEEVETACWYDVRKGKAEIFMALNEEELKGYEVEVTGINYIDKNKNIKLKITDERLIEKAGGVVQGMSGSPLMQNRKAYWCDKLRYNRRPKCCICSFCR